MARAAATGWNCENLVAGMDNMLAKIDEGYELHQRYKNGYVPSTQDEWELLVDAVDLVFEDKMASCFEDEEEGSHFEQHHHLLQQERLSVMASIRAHEHRMHEQYMPIAKCATSEQACSKLAEPELGHGNASQSQDTSQMTGSRQYPVLANASQTAASCSQRCEAGVGKSVSEEDVSGVCNFASTGKRTRGKLDPRMKIWAWDQAMHYYGKNGHKPNKAWYNLLWKVGVKLGRWSTNTNPAGIRNACVKAFNKQYPHLRKRAAAARPPKRLNKKTKILPG